VGYRSEVGFVIRSKPRAVDGNDAVSLFVPRFEDIEESNLFDTIIRPPVDVEIPNDRDAFLYHVEQVKWYEGFKVVDAVAEFLNMLDYEDFLFIRVGDDADDNEAEGSYWNNPYDMGMERRITFSGDI